MDKSCKTCVHVYDHSAGNVKVVVKKAYYDGCSLGMMPPSPVGAVDLSTIGCPLHRAERL